MCISCTLFLYGGGWSLLGSCAHIRVGVLLQVCFEEVMHLSRNEMNVADNQMFGQMEMV